MNAPETYLSEIKFHDMSMKKQQNQIKYAKGQVTHYKKIIDGGYMHKNGTIFLSDPSADVFLKWWTEVLNIMEITKKNK